MNLKKLIVLFPIIFVVIYFFAGIFYEVQNIIYVKPFIIPSFILYAIINTSKKLTLNYFLFVFFFYTSEVLLLFWEESIQLYRIALIASFFCYLILINLGYKSIKNKNLYTFPTGFTLFILLLNALFLVAILYILVSTIGDVYLNIILIFNSIVALLLGITAVLYLGKITTRKSYYYFFGAFALIFSDIFVAIVTYFMDNVVLNTLDRVLHFSSFLLIYLYTIEDKKVLKMIN